MTNTTRKTALHTYSSTLHNHRKQAQSVQGVCRSSQSLGSRRHAKIISKESPMRNFYTKVNKWAATGRQRGDRAGLALALLTSQLERTCMERWLWYLRCQSSSRHRLGAGQESREGKESEIELYHEDAVFCGHSKAEALGAHGNRTLIFIKTISNTDMVQDIF